MGAWGVGGDTGGRRNGKAAEGDNISGDSIRNVSGVTSEPTMQERKSAVMRLTSESSQRTTAGLRRLLLARKERHGAMNGHCH